MPLEFLLLYALIMDGVYLALMRSASGEFEDAWKTASQVLHLSDISVQLSL